MKKLLNPMRLTILGLFFFFASYSDATIHQATNYSELSIVGKMFTLGIVMILMYFVMIYIFVPLVNWIVKL